MGIIAAACIAGVLALVVPFAVRHNHNTISRRNQQEFVPYKVYGRRENPAIVLIPGLDGCTSFFMDSVPELTLNYFVVVYNIPLVEPPFGAVKGNEKPSYNHSYMAECLATALRDLRIHRATILGESFGGMIAQRFVLDYPDFVDRLILLSSMTHTVLTPVVRFKAKVLLPIVQGLGILFPGLAQTLFAVIHCSDVVEAQEPDWVKSFFVKEAMFADHYSVMARLHSALAWDIRPEVSGIKTGALVLYGMQDTFTAAGASSLEQGIDGAVLRGLPGGHLPHVSDPKAFVAVVRQYLEGYMADDVALEEHKAGSQVV